jgi:hypothetical protein
MILDILTVLFFVLGFALILWMVGERRRDVLHGPYVTSKAAFDRWWEWAEKSLDSPLTNDTEIP